MKLAISIHIFEKSSNIRFHEGPSIGSRVVLHTDGQRARHMTRLYSLYGILERALKRIYSSKRRGAITRPCQTS